MIQIMTIFFIPITYYIVCVFVCYIYAFRHLEFNLHLIDRTI